MATVSVKRRSTAKNPGKSTPDVDNHKLVSYTLDSLEGGVITISRDGVVTSFNSVAENMLGFTSEEAVGESYRQIIPGAGDARQIVEMIQAALSQGQTFSSEEAVIATRSRERIPVGMTISQLRDENGTSLGVVLIFKNLAEIKRMRDQILRTEQMAALGYLSAGLAHELRNPLGSLLGMAELIQDDLEPGHPHHAYTQMFMEQIERLNNLVEDLLCFAQPPISKLERCSLNHLLMESALFARYDFQDKEIEVVTSYAPDLPAVMADGERLSRAVLNIIRNAYQAVPNGGTITLATGTRERGGELRAYASVTNSGSYVDPDVRRKLFTPFFTLKKDGTGLGLSIAHQIVKGHSGYIEVDSDPEEGTTFTIDMPTAESVVRNSKEANNANSHTG